MRFSMITAIGFCCMMVAAGVAFGESGWQARIPNGTVLNCAACHTSAPDLNPFGTDFLATNPADPLWTTDLANLDSDGDTFSNGVELQDPAGAWVFGQPDPGDPGLVTNPGDDTSASVDGTTWGKIKGLFSEL